MKRLLITLALTTVLSVAAMAGDMHTTDSPAPAPSGTPQGMRTTSPSQTVSVHGDIPTSESTQPVLDGALSALLSVLGLVF
jgi:hypothetical protein